MISEIFTVCAGPIAELASQTCIFSECQIESVLYVRVPYQICTQYDLLNITQVSDSVNTPIDTDEYVTYLRYRPWIDIVSSALDMTPGHHMYRIQFKQRYTNIPTSLFFAYTIQSDNPEKPYIYMEEHTESEGGEQ